PTATTSIYTLSLHDALPISLPSRPAEGAPHHVQKGLTEHSAGGPRHGLRKPCHGPLRCLERDISFCPGVVGDRSPHVPRRSRSRPSLSHISWIIFDHPGFGRNGRVIAWNGHLDLKPSLFGASSLPSGTGVGAVRRHHRGRRRPRPSATCPTGERPDQDRSRPHGGVGVIRDGPVGVRADGAATA